MSLYTALAEKADGCCSELGGRLLLKICFETFCAKYVLRFLDRAWDLLEEATRHHKIEIFGAIGVERGST